MDEQKGDKENEILKNKNDQKININIYNKENIDKMKTMINQE